MKLKIPEQLTTDIPQNIWGKILGSTPVIMTVVATLLAGLASSEMTRAQYNRALAAQLQSKAGDQWSFFQAKRLRGSLQRSTLDILQATAPIKSLSDASLPGVEPAVRAALQTGALPATPASSSLGADVAAALEAVESSQSEADIDALLAKVKGPALAEAVRTAVNDAQAFDRALQPVNQAINQLERSAGTQRDFIAARLRYTAARYDAEARLNQTIANLYELQVRQSNHTAERHHARSQQFFFGMLVAQAAVIISTLAIAARKRNLLWSLAALAGLAAIAFAIYVYLYV